MNSQARASQARAVEHLQDLYSVVVAIALGLAVERVVVSGGSIVPGVRGAHGAHALFTPSSIPLAGALVVTVLPFYYGALRHLDAEYSPSSGRGAKPYALLVDFSVLFLESCTFLALGAAVDAPRTFGWTLATLLVIDVLWAAVALLWLTPTNETGTAVEDRDRPAERGWLVINAICAPIVIALLVLTAHWSVGDSWLRWALLGVAIVRTSVDLKVGWKLYTAM